MSESREEPQTVKETISEAIALLAVQAQRTLRQELEKARSGPNPPFFLKLNPASPDLEHDEELQRDLVELQNFADVLAETMVQLLKQAEHALLEKMKKTETDQRKITDRVNGQKQREDEVRNFTKIFADTRATLVEQVKDIVKEIRKGQGDDESSPKRPESIFSVIGIEPACPEPNPRKRPASYDIDRGFPKNPRISPPPKKTVVEEDDICYICNETGHWAYQCDKPDTRMCYICNKKGHISTKCSLPENRVCYKCNSKGHIGADCKVDRDRDRERERIRNLDRRRKSRSWSDESSSSYSD